MRRSYERWRGRGRKEEEQAGERITGEVGRGRSGWGRVAWLGRVPPTKQTAAAWPAARTLLGLQGAQCVTHV